MYVWVNGEDDKLKGAAPKADPSRVDALIDSVDDSS